MERLAVLLPCYNEALTIAKVIADFKKALPEADIYVYDNNSQDDTANVAEKAGAIVTKEKRQGKGNVVRSMFRDIEADYYIMSDGDETYDATAAPSLLRRLKQKKYDMLVAARVKTSGNNYRNGHIFGNWIINKVVKLFFNREFKDMLSGYRVFTRRFVKSMPILCRGFEIETEMTIHALSMKLSIGDIDIKYFSRPEGSVSKLRTFKDGYNILIHILRLFKDYRPLLLFGLVTILLLILSLVFITPVFLDYLSSGLVPKLPTYMTGLICLILAVLTLLTGLILDSIARFNLRFLQLALLNNSIKK